MLMVNKLVHKFLNSIISTVIQEFRVLSEFHRKPNFLLLLLFSDAKIILIFSNNYIRYIMTLF
jgi:hypothetical protein